MKRQLLAIVGFIFLCVSSYATTFMKVETTDGNIDRYDVENVIEVDFETEMTHEYVDLGLPSGTLWATCNIGATQPEEYGDYFAWGETEPKKVYDMSTYKWQKNNIFTKYNPDIDSYTTLLPEDDAATANWGDEWRMPTSEEQIELFKECTYSWEEVDGVYGAKFTGPNGNSVFFPAVGCRYLSYLDYVGENGHYWSSSLYDTDFAYYMDFNEKSSYEGHDFVRYGGCSVRAVRAQKQQRFVDLGLPSGTLWATCNIGASQPEEYGDYFAWGETKPKEVYNLGTYKWIKDNVFTKYNQDIDSYSTLLPEDDAATANWGDEWRMPTSDEQRELVEKCTYSWEEVNGVYGAKFTGPNGNSVFFPAASYRSGSAAYDVGNYGYYWSSSLYETDENGARRLFFDEEGALWNPVDNRGSGFPVRAVRAQKQQQYVDLGLPSGTLWATCNIGASQPEEYGDYFAWGETEPKSVFNGKNYKWGDFDHFTKYNPDIDSYTTLLPEDDAATANWGAQWRMPTTEDMQELIDNCEYSWEEVNGVYGAKFTAKNGNSLFFPVPGDVNGLDVKSSGIYAGYWSSSLCKMYENNAYFLNFSDEYAECGSNGVRYYGHPVRAVQTQESMESTEPTEPHEVIYMRVKTADGNIVRYNMENVVKVDFETESTHEYVDLGLPSGTQWATCNIGASQPEEYGDYFAWGETKPKEVYNLGTYKWIKDDVYTKYNQDIDSYSTLLPEDDAATANWGDEWRMPTSDEQRELVEKCTYSWEEVNGVYGAKFTGPNGNSVFFPAAGYRSGLGVSNVGGNGLYWSSSLNEKGEYLARSLGFDEEYAYWSTYSSRFYGFPVRAVRAQK